MSLFLEYHLIQNFAPSNLNRDDTGSPKDAIFGGHRRARLSSQSQKKAQRDFFKTSNLLDAKDLGVRTRHLDRVMDEILREAGLSDASIFNEIVKLALKGKKKDKDSKDDDKEEKAETILSYLLFISHSEIESLKALVMTDESMKMLKDLAGKKKLKATDISDEFRAALKSILEKSRAVDIALFGRMLADLPKANQYAACQVAHAISTHRVEREFDYFSAVDDKRLPEESGAAHIQQTEFNSATFYRYSVLDANKLLANLHSDRGLTLSAVEAFTQAMVRAIPSGKQNSFAAHNAPTFIGVCLRHATPLNLANAFEKPLRPSADKALSHQSVERLAEYEYQLASVYGTGEDVWIYLDLTALWSQGDKAGTLDELAKKVRALIDKKLEK